MLEVLFGLVVLCAILALPILLLGLLFRVLFEVILIPFHVLGALVHLLLSGAGVVLKVVVGLAVGLVVLVALPLLPLLLAGALVWAFVKLLQPRQVMVVRS